MGDASIRFDNPQWIRFWVNWVITYSRLPVATIKNEENQCIQPASMTRQYLRFAYITAFQLCRKSLSLHLIDTRQMQGPLSRSIDLHLAVKTAFQRHQQPQEASRARVKQPIAANLAWLNAYWVKQKIDLKITWWLWRRPELWLVASDRLDC